MSVIDEITNTAARPLNISTYNLGNSNQNKRVWLQTRYLQRIGFERHVPIKIDFSKENRTITISKNEFGTHKVAGRMNGMPIIDIKNKCVAETLGEEVDKITVKFYATKIIISVSTFEIKKAQRRAKTGNKAVEIFSGAGTYTKFSEMAGFKIDTVVERDDRFLEVFEHNVDAVTTICADVNDIDVLDLPSDCSLLSFGYPCTAFSDSNLHLKKKIKALDKEAIEEQREANYLSLALVNIIKRVNARVVAIEEVSAFKDSLPYDLLTYALEQMHYKITVQTVTGSYTNRKRIAIVAIADDVALDLSDIEYKPPMPIEAHLQIPVSERDFQPIENRPRESGALRKGLGIRSHLPSDLKINTITTHWTRHNHVSLEHPYKSQYYSDFTVDEIKSLHGLPSDFYCGSKITIARSALGQGVADGFLGVLKKIYDRVCNSHKLITELSKREKKASEQMVLEW